MAGACTTACADSRPTRARLGPSKAISLVKTGSNLRLKKKLFELDYEVEMRSWMQEPEDSDDEDDGADDDGAVADGA